MISKIPCNFHLQIITPLDQTQVSRVAGRRPGFHPWVGKLPWRWAWQPTPVFLPGEFHWQRSLAGTVHGVTKSRTQLSEFHFLSFFFFFYTIQYENFNSVWKVEKVEFLPVRKAYRWMIKTHRAQISYFWTTWSLLWSKALGLYLLAPPLRSQ